MTPRIGQLLPGSRGFDCNTHVTARDAAFMKAAKYDYVVRYVSRGMSHSYDTTINEMIDILRAGLAIMLVQHVAMPGWRPSPSLGGSYGSMAALHAKQLGYLRGATVWCDLEEVNSQVSDSDIIQYCNNWYDAVFQAGYEPGLYVGSGCGLSADQLYRKLKFRRYWSAYNLNRDEYPIVRGVQMRQLPYPVPSKRVHGILFQYDEDVIQVDALGSTPILLLP